MAITQAITTSYKEEVLQGIHDAADTYKMALYTSAATLGATTTAYTATNEVVGIGYTAGGVTLSGFNVTTSGTTAEAIKTMNEKQNASRTGIIIEIDEVYVEIIKKRIK